MSRKAHEWVHQQQYLKLILVKKCLISRLKWGFGQVELLMMRVIKFPTTARKTIRFWSAFSTCWWLFDVIGGQDLLRSTWVRSRGKWEVYWLYIGTNNCCCCGTLLILIASLHSLKAKKLKGLPLENLDRQRNQSSSSKMARWQCRRLVFWKSWPKWKNQSGNFLYWSTLEYLITVQHPLILDFIWLANKDNLMLLNWW